MKLKNIKEKEYSIFLENYAYKNFLNTANIGNFKKTEGNRTHYLGLFDNDKLVAACLLIEKKNKEFYAMRGLLVDYNDENILNEFINQLKKHIKKNNGFVLRIDPYIPYHERDAEGNIVENGIDNSHIVNNLKKIGFREVPYEERIQASWLYTLDVKNKTLEEIMKPMDSKTRQMIRKNEKNGIIIREGNENDLELFVDIYNNTGERKSFNTHTLEYYTNFYNACKNDMKLIIAEIHTDVMINNIKNEIDEIEKKMALCEKSKEKMNENKYNKKINDFKNDLERLSDNMKKAENLKSENGNIIPVASILYFIYGNEVLSLSGGTYEKYIKWQPFYTINFEMIKYAIENNYEVYNFYGISKNLVKSDEQYGIYEFKKGFGGQVVELIGEFELPISYKYWFYLLKKNIRKKIK